MTGYPVQVVIAIDEPKRLANLVRHGIDQREVTASFFETALVIPTYASRRTGRERFMAIGLLTGRGLVSVIYSPLGREGLGLVSVRSASDRERNLHAQRS